MEPAERSPPARVDVPGARTCGAAIDRDCHGNVGQAWTGGVVNWKCGTRRRARASLKCAETQLNFAHESVTRHGEPPARSARPALAAGDTDVTVWNLSATPKSVSVCADGIVVRRSQHSEALHHAAADERLSSGALDTRRRYKRPTTHRSRPQSESVSLRRSTSRSSRDRPEFDGDKHATPLQARRSQCGRMCLHLRPERELRSTR